ncbi:hypothetical protein CsSME_00000029 [Camellia sinensis var. sinensis]
MALWCIYQDCSKKLMALNQMGSPAKKGYWYLTDCVHLLFNFH